MARAPQLRRTTRATLGLVALVSAALLTPAAAQAGTVPGGFSSEAPTTGCFNTASGCGNYAFAPGGTSGTSRISLPNVTPRRSGEAGYIDLAAPEWPHSRLQGYQARVDFTGSALNTGWEAGTCTAAQTVAAGLCQSPYSKWGGAGSPAITVTLAEPTDTIRVALRYSGADGTPPQIQTQFRATVRWFEVDTEAPKATLTASDGQAIGAREIRLNADAGEPNAVRFDAAGEDNTEIGSTQVSVDGGAATDLPAAGGSFPVPDGAHALAARVCDVAVPANCGALTGKVTIDSGRPQVTLDPLTATANPQPAIAATVTDPTVNGFASGLQSLRLSLNDGPVDFTQTVDGSKYTLTPKAPLPDGRYQLQVIGRDLFGNEGTPSLASGASPELVIDNAAPTAEAVSPPPGAKLRTSPTQISARLKDNVGIFSSKMLLDGAQVNADFSEPDLTYLPETKLCPGPHVVQVSGSDAVGRTAEALWTFSIRGALRGSCARIACSRNKLQAKRFRRTGSFALKSERKNRRLLKRARTKEKRAFYKANVTRWRESRIISRKALKVVSKNARVACKAAQRTTKQRSTSRR